MTKEEQAELIWKYSGLLKVLLYISLVVLGGGYSMALIYAENSPHAMALVAWITVILIGLSGMLAVLSKVIDMAADTMELMVEEIEELNSR